jgi:hypothetical protein
MAAKNKCLAQMNKSGEGLNATNERSALRYGPTQRRANMRIVGLLSALALLSLIAAEVAFAGCPPGMPYGCQQTFNGKMRCGCGY